MSDYLAADLLLSQLAAEGTSVIFGPPGQAVSPIMDALEERHDIKYVSALHEGIAVSMAAGYSQASGKAGVVNPHSISGLSNGLAALINAAASRIPLVATVGQYDSRLLNDLPSFSSHICTLVESFSKWSCELKSADEIPRVLRRAFHEAMSPPMGISVVSLPINLLKQSTGSKIILPGKISPLAAADNSFLKRVANLLVSAARPVIIAGNEIGQYHARQEIVSLTEVLGCPAFSEPRPTAVNFPNQHQLFAGILPSDSSQARELLKDHDVVLICGMQTRTTSDFEDTGFIAATSVVAQINIDSSLAGISLPCHFSASGDLRESLAKLRAEVQLLVDTSWVSKARVRSRHTMNAILDRKNHPQDAVTGSPDDQSIPPSRLLSVLDKARPAKSVVFNDSLSYAELPLSVMKFERSRSYCSSNGGGSGYGVSAALGAAISDSECTAICLTGDSSFLHYPQALWTASAHGLSIKVIVLDNRSHSLGNRHTKAGAEKQPEIDLAKLAASMSIPAQTISRLSEVEPAVSTMFAQLGPYLLHVRLQPS